MIAGMTFLLSTIWILWLVLPIRLLNPLFRKLGIPNNALPSDLAPKFWDRIFLRIMGFSVSIEGTENVPRNQALILMYSHASGLDPFFLLGYTPVSVKFVFKKSLLWIAPYLFPLAYLYGHIPIDRSNRERGIASIEKAGNIIKTFKRSVCISPEGTRSPTGELLEFKKGPFHLCHKTGVSIIPVVLFNNFELWPKNHLFPLSGEVRLRFLPKIDTKEEEPIEILSDRVRSVMLESLKNKPDIKETPERITLALIWLFLLALGVYFFLTKFFT